MSFKDYLAQAWKQHAADAETVADGFSSGAKLVTSNEELAQLVALATHVMGEHLARWDDGAKLLQDYRQHPQFEVDSETDKAITRSTAALAIGRGANPSLAAFGQSDQVRVLAVAAAALCNHDVARAISLLQQALQRAEQGLESKDPAHRALAVTGNNLAATLEERQARSAEETDLMILAAQTGRKYWELAGTWYEVAFAEYRLAMTFIQLGDRTRALLHARNCVQLLSENSASAEDLAYGQEAVAMAEKLRT